MAHGRPLNFDDLAVTLHFAELLVTKESQYWPELDHTIAQLQADPSFVFGLSIPTYAQNADDKKHNLPQPDFDETGFLGRDDQVKEVIKRCLGPYPVITLSGEGGVGKTALALKVAYEILDLKTSSFDAIVWTTSKTTMLTPHEIVRIRGAISDSLGLFQDIATTLAGRSDRQAALDEVLGYLTEFKILLILDNLETVLDDRIREFLQAMPMGSKVLITSRVGRGAFEFPYKVPALEPSEAVSLLRALAKVRGVADLAKLPVKRLETYCERMKNNPGWIKWFVSAIRAGSRPEDVLENSDMFLDFCMSGVYKFLTPGARQVLRSMLSVPDQHSQAELAFLNGMDAADLQRALQLLLTTNFIQMNGIVVGSGLESRYSISELGREFLIKHHPATPIEHGQFIQKRRLLVAAGEEIKSEQNTNPFSYRSIATRSPSDLIIARYLLDALSAADRKKFRRLISTLLRQRN